MSEEQGEDKLMAWVARARAAQAAVNAVIDQTMTDEQRSAKLDDLEATIGALEVTAVVQAKKLFASEYGFEPTYMQLQTWARHTHRHTIADFLRGSHNNRAINALFTTKEQPHGGDQTG